MQIHSKHAQRGDASRVGFHSPERHWQEKPPVSNSSGDNAKSFALIRFTQPCCKVESQGTFSQCTLQSVRVGLVMQHYVLRVCSAAGETEYILYGRALHRTWNRMVTEAIKRARPYSWVYRVNLAPAPLWAFCLRWVRLRMYR